jgi:hypothetical protein
MKFDIIFSNKASSLNKKLIKFFQLNLLSLNKSSLIFDFDVAHPEEMSKYTAKGIKNYPILVFEESSVTGVEKIITYLKMLVKKHNDKIINKSADDHVSDFWKDTISGKEEDDGEGGEDADPSDNIHKKIQEAFEQRNDAPGTKPKKNLGSSPASSVHASKPSKSSGEKPSETLKKMKGNSMDDELMAKFFENQGESLED